MDPFQVCCLGEKWRLSVGKSRGRARQKDKEAMEELQERLLSAKNCSEEEATELRALLRTYLVIQLKVLAKNLGVKLTGASKKNDLVERILGMCRLGVVRTAAGTEDDDSAEEINLPYCTDELKEKLKELPKFSDISLWTKDLAATLKDFTFMNLLEYLVCSRDKTFDMKSMKAFKSLKAYKFFDDDFVKNVWLHDLKTDSPRIVYARGFVQHSLSLDLPLEVFVSLNGDTGDVFGGQCNCVSG